MLPKTYKTILEEQQIQYNTALKSIRKAQLNKQQELTDIVTSETTAICLERLYLNILIQAANIYF